MAIEPIQNPERKRQARPRSGREIQGPPARGRHVDQARVLKEPPMVSRNPRDSLGAAAMAIDREGE